MLGRFSEADNNRNHYQVLLFDQVDKSRTSDILTSAKMIWIFSDSRNAAVIITKAVLFADDWIAYVSHDMEDGRWQFHADYFRELTEADVAVVSLESVISKDETLLALFNLPIGWHAWRTSKEDVWQRQEMPG